MKRVLYVDDDLVSQKLLENALGDAFEVVGETSGARVVERAEQEKPNVILLDLSMPNVDGFEVLTRLKKHPRLANIPVICVSGKVDEESRQRVYRAGASGFISKPISIHKIEQDMLSILQSLDSEVKSEDGKRSVYIGRNADASYERMKSLLQKRLSQDAKVVVMSLTEGATFFKDFDQDYLKTGRLVYLEIKPSLIVRLPYLEELSSVEQDLSNLLDLKNEKFGVELFLDAPEQILNISNQEKSSATILAVSESFSRVFSHVNYFSRYENDETANKHINAMAKMLARVS